MQRDDIDTEIEVSQDIDIKIEPLEEEKILADGEQNIKTELTISNKAKLDNDQPTAGTVKKMNEGSSENAQEPQGEKPKFPLFQISNVAMENSKEPQTPEKPDIPESTNVTESTINGDALGTSSMDVPITGEVEKLVSTVGDTTVEAAEADVDHFCLRWNNYQINVTDVFDELLDKEVFVDVTLSCEGGEQLRAHKVVLAACSSYFQALLENNPCEHPIIILPHTIAFADLQAIIKFIYRGEIVVAQEQINSILEVANYLKIKCFCKHSNDPVNISPEKAAPSLPSRSSPRTSRNRNEEKPQTPSSEKNNASTSSESADSREPHRASGRRRGRVTRFSRYRTIEEEPDTSELQEEPSEEAEMKNEEEHMSDEEDEAAYQQVPLLIYQSDQLTDDTASTSHCLAELGAHTLIKTEDEDSQTLSYPHEASGSTSDQDTLLPQVLRMMQSEESPHYDSDSEDVSSTPSGRKLWSEEDMKNALDSLRNSTMSTSRASKVFRIPYPTLWKKAHNMGIEIPKREFNRSWSEDDLADAMEEIRSGRLSAQRASKVFKIPSSTLYKIARKEGLNLSANMSRGSHPSWSNDALSRAFSAIRAGRSVQKSSKLYGIPLGTLYARCRREGIVLSKSQAIPWTHEDMKSALEAVRVGQMSVNQASLQFHVPYSSLYVRLRRKKKTKENAPRHEFLHRKMALEQYAESIYDDVDEEELPEEQPQHLQSTPQSQSQEPSSSFPSVSPVAASSSSSKPLQTGHKKRMAKPRAVRGRKLANTTFVKKKHHGKPPSASSSTLRRNNSSRVD